MEFESGDRPVIVRRVKKVQHGHHGGAWKVAFADFATAMMAFFLVLWLMEAATIEEKAAISGYFSDPTAFTEGGSPYVIDLGGGLKDDQYSGESNVETPDTKIQDKGIVLTEDRIIRSCNATFAEIFGYPVAELTGQTRTDRGLGAADAEP